MRGRYEIKMASDRKTAMLENTLREGREKRRRRQEAKEKTKSILDEHSKDYKEAKAIVQCDRRQMVEKEGGRDG